MLAAGGLLGLLLMGAAVGGLMSGADDAPDDDASPGDDAAAPSGEMETGEFGTDQAGNLADLLFGDGGDIDDFDELADPDAILGQLDPPQSGGSAASDEASYGVDLGPDVHDVAATTPFGDGPDIPFVTGFDCDTDRLILDFDGTEDEAPAITVDLESSPGDAVVEANGTAVTLVEGASTLTPQHVDVVMTGLPATDAAPADEEAAGLSREGLLDGGTLTDLPQARADIQQNFDGTDQDALTGGIGDDAIDGTTKTDAIFGGEGNDSLVGHGSSDELYGDTGADSLEGGEGADFLSGCEGGDTLRGGADGDFAFGGEGADLIEGGTGDDGLQGGPGADTIFGGGGDDVIDGSFASGPAFAMQDADRGDLIDGGDGQDTVFLGVDDTVTGGDGTDTFITGDYAGEAGIVTDFDPLEDRIEVVYDAEALPDPEIGVVDFEDGTGARITVNGETVLQVLGAQGLDPAEVELRPLDRG